MFLRLKWEVSGTCITDKVDLAVSAKGQAPDEVVSVSAQIAGIDKLRPIRLERCDDAVALAAVKGHTINVAFLPGTAKVK